MQLTVRGESFHSRLITYADTNCPELLYALAEPKLQAEAAAPIDLIRAERRESFRATVFL